MSQWTEAKNGKRHTGTQTNDMDTILEIARLQEQVKLLTIEIEHLRKNTYTVEKRSTILKQTTPSPSLKNANETLRPTKSRQENPQIESTQKKNKTLMRGCNCKGSCSSKICGCVKKHIQCGELCRCSNVCQNQERKDENNKENIGNDKLTPMEIRKAANEHLVYATVSKRLFSPDVTTHRSSPDIEQSKPISLNLGSSKKLLFNSDEKEKENVVEEKNVKNRLRKYDKGNKKDGTRKRARPKKNPVDRELSNDHEFDPMKPKHELARTPVHGNSNTSPHDISNASVVAPVMREEEFPIPPELKEAEVDWNEYQSRLIPCSKCKRKFHSSRIKKHESCCKRV